MKQHSLFIFTYVLILITSQYIFFDYFNIYHADHFYYLDEVNKYKNNYNFLEIFTKILSFSTDINLPLIFFYPFIFKIIDSTNIILIVNTFFTLFIFIKINKILLSFKIENIYY